MSTLNSYFMKFMNGRQPDVFLETGSCRGASIDAALSLGFKNIYSTDMSPALVTDLMEKYKDYPNISLNLSSSPYFLEHMTNVLASKDRHAVIYLDAHFQGEEDPFQIDPTFGQCPLLAEIKALSRPGVFWKVPPLILIDDVHLFSGEYFEANPDQVLFDRAQWPTLEEIYKAFSDAREASVAFSFPPYAFERDGYVLYCYPLLA